MTIVFDLDYTLMDTHALKEELKHELSYFGLSARHFDATIGSLRCDPIAGTKYDPREHVALMHPFMKSPEDGEAALASLMRVAARSRTFLYPGTIATLERLRERGHRLLLLSYGEPAWQQAKIIGSGLTPLFDGIALCTASKADMVAGLVRAEERTVFVNDNAAESASIRKAFPQYAHVLHAGPKPIPPDSDMPTYRGYAELETMIAAIAADDGVGCEKIIKEKKVP